MKNHLQDVAENLAPDSLLKNQTCAYILINILKFHTVCLSVCLFRSKTTKTLKLSGNLIAFTSYKAFLKNKKRSGTSLPGLLSARFLKKKIFHVIFY